MLEQRDNLPSPFSALTPGEENWPGEYIPSDGTFCQGFGLCSRLLLPLGPSPWLSCFQNKVRGRAVQFTTQTLSLQPQAGYQSLWVSVSLSTKQGFKNCFIELSQGSKCQTCCNQEAMNICNDQEQGLGPYCLAGNHSSSDTWDKLLIISVPQFPSLQYEENGCLISQYCHES